MTREQCLLTILAEECGETAQRATKAIRFGLSETQKGQEETNAERLVYEFNDILAMMKMLEEEGYIEMVIDDEAIEKKKIKVEKYMAYSKELGMVNDN